MSKTPNIRRRRIRAKPSTKEERSAEALTSYERQTKVALNYVNNHPQYPTIVGMMRMGTSNADIADFFIERGDFQVNRKTAVSYLSMFRKANPSVCKPTENDSDILNYDHLFDGNRAIVTAETELAKLIQLQKARISIDFNSERSIGKLFNTTHKEVAILGELLEKYTKIRMGRGSNGAGVSSSVPLSEDVKDGVQNIRHDEEKRNVITNALFNLLNPGE
jgi:hypothetical protein